ncbi:Transcriptional activator FeaR [Pandoraea iniqua]|uniref:AraC family transcriptional regulator n=1 Tax=Pandoraea iniqua TaxID=2508288 RepID=UPI00123EF9EC|nr:AraC family transcriptional regulator [Pandoraea iniqua]VVE58661.1 Transcriptional activator FeaR [Pandoraea iniqua]
MTTKEIVLTTTLVDAADKVDYWREAMSPLFEIGLPPSSTVSALDGECRIRSTGELMLLNTRFSDQIFFRSEAKARKADADVLLLQLICGHGLMGRFGTSAIELRYGDLLIQDIARACITPVVQGRTLTIVVDRICLERLLGRSDLNGVVLRREQPTTRLLADYLKTLWDVALDLNAADASLALDVVGRLMKAGTGNALVMSPEEEAAYADTMHPQIHAYIRQKLAGTDLTPETIMARFNMSRTGLYRAMDGADGIARVIRNTRLDAALALLIKQKGLPISQVAYQCGFSSPQHFYKAFRRKFGHSPIEAREAHHANTAPPSLRQIIRHYGRVERSYMLPEIA